MTAPPAPPVTATIAELAAAYRSGALSPVEVTRACLDRIAAVDGTIRAFVTVTAERALAAARAAQDALRDDPDGTRPLLGIPVAVKEIVDVAGVEVAAGSAALAGRVPRASALAWRRLEQAGALLVGMARTHELAYGVRTPPTCNPWDTTRIPGGSSGGSAAALAAGMCVAAVGTDTAGSIRIPSALCGTVGLKPTAGLCPTDRVHPLSPSLDHVGPMARGVDDLRLLLDAMAGARTAAPVTRAGGSATGAGGSATGRVPATGAGSSGTGAAALAGLRVGLARSDALMAPEVAAALERVAGALEAAGAVVGEAGVPSFAVVEDAAAALIIVEAAEANATLLADAADRLGAATRAKLERRASVDDRAYDRARRHMARVRDGMRQVFAAHDVLLAPAVAVVAPRHDEHRVTVGGSQVPFSRAACLNMSLANMTGVPAVALPAGTAGGLPVGVQLLGPAGADRRLLAIAAAVARHLGPAAAPRPPELTG